MAFQVRCVCRYLLKPGKSRWRKNGKKSLKLTIYTIFTNTTPATTIFNYNWSNFNIPADPFEAAPSRRCLGLSTLCRNKNMPKLAQGLVRRNHLPCSVCFHPLCGVTWTTTTSVSQSRNWTRNLNVCGAKGGNSVSCASGAVLMWCVATL